MKTRIESEDLFVIVLIHKRKKIHKVQENNDQILLHVGIGLPFDHVLTTSRTKAESLIG